jgi:enoyl-CoA hydratase
MSEPVVLYDEKDDVATITINRPDKYNALNVEVKKALLDMFKRAEGAASVRAIVLTGAGKKAFVSGSDISDFKGRDSESIKPIVGGSRDIGDYVETMYKPIIAAVNGYALGGGCELAMVCDIRYASANARFGLPEINLGTLPGNGGTVRLPRLVGLGIAKELVLTGTLIDAEEARRIGLVNRVFDSVDALREGVRELALNLASKPGVAQGLANRSLDKSWQLPVDEHLAFELDVFCQTFDTEDNKEGVAAFLEKRSPDFKHR